MSVESTVKKLHDEGKKLGGNGALIARYLGSWLKDHPQDEAAMSAKGKSIKGCIEAMKQHFRSRATMGMAIVSEDEGYGAIRAYYGLGTVRGDDGTATKQEEENAAAPDKPQAYTAEDEMNLFGDDRVATGQEEEHPAPAEASAPAEQEAREEDKPSPHAPSPADVMSVSLEDFL